MSQHGYHGKCPAARRVMWYSAPHRDWDITNGTAPQEVSPGIRSTLLDFSSVPCIQCVQCMQVLQAVPCESGNSKCITWCGIVARQWQQRAQPACDTLCHTTVASRLKPLQDDILMWGGFAGREKRPQHVTGNWSLAAEFMTNFTLMVSVPLATTLPFYTSFMHSTCFGFC